MVLIQELLMTKNTQLVTPAGFEPAIAGLRTRSPGPLDEGANDYRNESYHIC